MAESRLTLTDEEVEFLVALLDEARKETLVEEHHASKRAFRGLLARRADLIAGLLRKLTWPPI
jgi:hypothetical protein